MRYLFDANSNVVITEECNFILALSRRYKKVRTLDNKTIQCIIRDLKRCKHFENLVMDFSMLENMMKEAAKINHYSELCRMIQLSNKSIHNKTEILITGDKNPSYSSEYFHKIHRLFPDAYYIHLVRDYHDHIASMVSGKFVLSNPIYLAIAWKKSIRLLAKYKKETPSKFFTIRYEDFVQHPEVSTNEICNFLHIPYQSEMFDFYKKKEEYIARHPNIDFTKTHKTLFKPVGNDRIALWLKLIKAKDINVIEFIAGKTGQPFGNESLHHKLTFRIMLLLIKWYLLYYITTILKALLFSLNVGRRKVILNKIRKNTIAINLYYYISGRKVEAK